MKKTARNTSDGAISRYGIQRSSPRDMKGLPALFPKRFGKLTKAFLVCHVLFWE
jgi:hypothetical protein